MNTHYGVIVFSGDPDGEHPDEELRGQPPALSLVACGSEEFCWMVLTGWTAKHPLRQWEETEVLARERAAVVARTQAAIAQCWQDTMNQRSDDGR